MASNAVADHDKRKKTSISAHFVDFSVFFFLIILNCSYLQIICFCFEAVSGKRVAVVGAGVR